MTANIKDIFQATQDFCDGNHLIDVADKVPIFICSIGAHIFNAINKCSMCDFDPSDKEGEEGDTYTIDHCPLRHDNQPIYTPMSQLADTRVHILVRGDKGSGKSVLIKMFCAENTGLLYNKEAFTGGIGFRTMIGPNSVTESGLFGSVSEDGSIAGRPLARELCGGFLGFEEFSSLTDAMRKDHSVDMKNQLLTSTDNGRVMKALKAGWVRYNTRYTIWAGTQPGRFEMASGLDRRFFILDIDMSPSKEHTFKKAQARQSEMDGKERLSLAELSMAINEWIRSRMTNALLDPPTGVCFDDALTEWIQQPAVRSFEADLFRRLAIGYTMMKPDYEGGKILMVNLDDQLLGYLNDSLKMRRNVMDADLALIKASLWGKDIPKSSLIKEVARMVCNGDYQQSKRWIEDNLSHQSWYEEYIPQKSGRGRRGIICCIGFKATPSPTPSPVPKQELKWGEQS